MIYQVHKSPVVLDAFLDDLSDTADAAEMDLEEGFKVVFDSMVQEGRVDNLTVEALSKKATSTPQWRNFAVKYQLKGKA